MQCTFHINKQIQFLCIASHKCQCQRKLCVDCIYDHGVDVKQTLPIDKFKEKALQQLKEFKPANTSEISKQRLAFKSLVSQTEMMLKKIWEELSESIKTTLDWIDKDNEQYTNLISENTNLAESSYTDLEKLVSFVQGNTNLNSQRTSQIMELEKIKRQWDQDIQSFISKQKETIKQISSIIKTQSNTQGGTNNQYREAPKELPIKQQGGRNIIMSTFDWKNSKVQELKKFDGHSSYVISVCISSDSTTLASGSYDKSIRLWDLKTGQQKVKLDGHLSSVDSVCFSPDGATLASGSNDNSIRLWDLKTSQQKAKLDGHSGRIWSVCFSPDGTALASGSSDNSICLWDLKADQQKAKLDGHSNSVQSVCFSPDGTILASGSYDKSIRIWDSKTGQKKTKLDGHSSYVQSICFSPDGTTVASGSNDKSIRLWDHKTGQQKAQLDGHSSRVNSVCFSLDGSCLASGSLDCSIRLWDVKTRQQKAKLDGHSREVMSVCFSPDGTTLASSSEDKSIRLWGAKSDK